MAEVNWAYKHSCYQIYLALSSTETTEGVPTLVIVKRNIYSFIWQSARSVNRWRNCKLFGSARLPGSKHVGETWTYGPKLNPWCNIRSSQLINRGIDSELKHVKAHIQMILVRKSQYRQQSGATFMWYRVKSLRSTQIRHFSHHECHRGLTLIFSTKWFLGSQIKQMIGIKWTC